MSDFKDGQMTESVLAVHLQQLSEYPILRELPVIDATARFVKKQDKPRITRNKLVDYLHVRSSRASKYLNFFVDVGIAHKQKQVYTFDEAKLSSFIQNMKAWETKRMKPSP